MAVPQCGRVAGGQGCAGQTVPGAHCPGQSDEEYRTEFTMWTIAASPIIVATNIMNMTDIMTEILLNADMIKVSSIVDNCM
jgi:alpha-galactosidase